MSQNSKTRIRRFTPGQRLFHLLLILTFLLQAATGLARLYIQTQWGKSLAWVFGGYEACRTVHIYGGIFLICLFLVHILHILIVKLDWSNLPGSLFGPDSLIPRPKDIRDFFLHLGWFLGLAKHPRFDRWGYWEKFDYWAVFWGIPLLGITGLLLAYPLYASRIIPGWGLNVALWIHRIEALLAMCHVFVIHFFIAHFRRQNFPMDRAMFEGSIDLESANHERPEWIARLKKAGELEKRLVPGAAPGRLVFFYLFGYAAMAVGLFLLIGGVVNSPYIAW
ncbi:MAG: cytochrome b/b6 domain-containing protein [Deltaproteobacteria bacterium]|nr:cytochrome b/b6 domain-containing protein [Deltaproteobacteria bacterium]MBW2070885.1 cytochrome b/b6 domain-containing protein [Deltaproteobacteria bacterium]